jgi:hypothetical protein
LMPAGVDTDTTARPRNRKATPSSAAIRNASTSRLSPGDSPIPSRAGSVSPLPSARIARTENGGRANPAPLNSNSNSAFSKGLLDGWSSVQDFASSFLAGGESGYNSESSRPGSRNGSKPRPISSMWKSLGGSNGAASSGRRAPDSWGPAPPTSSSRPRAEDIAAGSLAEREAALKAMKTASVLESYDGVNGGLDVAGKYKRRNSDEDRSRSNSDPVVEEHLVYLHHVLPDDTYAGVVLRYRCQEQPFRKTNGLWSRDNIQVRKHLLIPVDACELKGRPCDPPNFYNRKVDHLATTPQPESFIQSGAEDSQSSQPLHDDFFGPRGRKSQSLPEEELPWTHVRWVKLDSCEHPVEIVRVSRNAMGYFPPRRKKSIHTVSTFSTPRQSLELSRNMTAVSSESALDSPGHIAPVRRQSTLSHRPTIGSLGASDSAGRSRGSSVGQNESIPAWMRRPGGVGSMSRSVHAPGPAKDSLNAWVNKRLPKGFNIDSMPSMSVMGSESASWGFRGKSDEGGPSGIVESPFEDGRDSSLADSKQGIGLEQAAATIETWLRGAWAKRPATPRLGSQKRSPDDLDLIELTDTNSDDGHPRTPLRMPETNPSHLGYLGASGRSDGEGNVRGRSTGPKGKKSD